MENNVSTNVGQLMMCEAMGPEFLVEFPPRGPGLLVTGELACKAVCVVHRFQL